MKLMKNILFVMAISLSVLSCVQEEYDFDKVNLEMTVAPGISVPVDKTLDDVKTADLLDMGGCTTDTDGAYVSAGESVSHDIEVSSEDTASGTVRSDVRISVPVDVPDFLRKSTTEFRFHNPQICFTVTNPMPYAVTMNAKAVSAAGSFDFSVELPASAKDWNVSVSGEKVASILYPVPDCVTIEDISFTGAATKSQTADAGQAVYKIMASSRIRMEFEAGSEISFDSTLDLEEMGADLGKVEVSVNEFEIESSITSTFPLDLSASARSEDGSTSLKTENTVLSNATTEVKFLAKTDGKLSDIKSIVVSINAVNSTDSPVALTEGCTLSIDIDRLKATSGITYNPGK